MADVTVKTIRFWLNYRDDERMPYRDLCNALFGIQRELRRGLNAVSNTYKQHLERTVEVHDATGKWPTAAEIKEWYGCALQTEMYRQACKHAENISSGCITAAINSEIGKLKAGNKEFLRGDKTYPCYKSNVPVPVPNRNVKLTDECGKWMIELALFGKAGKAAYNLDSGSIRFEVDPKDDGTRAIVGRCADGEYEYGVAAVQYDAKKKRWYCNLCVKIPVEKRELNGVLGVDLGICNVAYCAVNGGFNRLSIPGGEIQHFRSSVEARKREMMKERKFAGEGSIGHGYKKRTEAFNRLEDKIARFRNSCNHKYSREIVNFAVDNGCGVIQMEDLSGISEESKFLKSWTYYDLQQKIENKAAEAGIVVHKIDPKYTSQRCSKCGYIHRDNRLTQAVFECQACGYTANADYNAARNIAIPGIAEIIGANVKLTA